MVLDSLSYNTSLVVIHHSWNAEGCWHLMTSHTRFSSFPWPLVMNLDISPNYLSFTLSVYPSAEDLLPRVSKDPSLHGFLLESFSAQFHTKIILKEELLILKLFPHPLVHGILTREPNRSVQSCMAAVAHANRGATLRDGRAAMYSAPLKAWI